MTEKDKDFNPVSNTGGIIHKMENMAKERYAPKPQLKNPRIIYTDPQIRELQKELMNHPELIARYKSIAYDFIAVIESLAAENEILLDGMYTWQDCLNICDILTAKLRKKRGALIVIGATNV